MGCAVESRLRHTEGIGAAAGTSVGGRGGARLVGTQPRRTYAMNERGLTLVGTQPRRSGAPRGVGAVVETRLRHTEGVGAAAVGSVE